LRLCPQKGIIMSQPILEIINTEEKQTIIIKALESYINRCKAIANSPIQGHGRVSEYEKKKRWAFHAEESQELLNNIVNEFN
jgi:hypothetical protein